MGVLILPLVSSLSEDAHHAVPTGLREDAYALGATRMQSFNSVSRPQAEFLQSAAAAIIVLLVLLLAMNAVAIWLRDRYQKQRTA